MQLLNEKHMEIVEICHKRDFTKLQALAEQLNVSNRSINNYINQLNENLKGIAQIKNKRGKGYYLLIENQENWNHILEEYEMNGHQYDCLQKRIAFIIKKLMDNQVTTMDELAEDLNVGRTTLVNDLKKASVVLKSHHIDIVGKPNHGMYISGDELSLRLFIVEHIYEYLYKHARLDPALEKAIFTIMKKHDFDDVTVERLTKFIVVMLDRISNHHFIETSEQKYNRIQETTEFQIAQEIKAVIAADLSMEIPINEVLYMTIPLTGRRTPNCLNSIEHTVVPDEIKRLLFDIIERISFELKINLNPEKISKDLEYHLTFMMNRVIFGIQNPNPIILEVKEKFPLAYTMAEIAGIVIEEYTGIRPSDDELGYLAFYFEVYLSEHELDAKNFQKVVIVCSTGRGTANIISIQLRCILGNQPSLDIYSEDDINKELLSEYDIVFTTIPIQFEVNVPVVKVSEIFDEKSMVKEIKKAFYLKSYQNHTDISSHSSLIGFLLDEQRFFHLQPELGYKESMLFMANELVKQNVVDEGFPERLLEREEKSTMVMDRSIALPHTIHHASNQIILALGVFSKPVTFRKKSVELIFMLAFPKNVDKDTGLLVNLYNEMIHVANHEGMISKIKKCESYNKLIFTLNEFLEG